MHLIVFEFSANNIFILVWKLKGIVMTAPLIVCSSCILSVPLMSNVLSKYFLFIWLRSRG